MFRMNNWRLDVKVRERKAKAWCDIRLFAQEFLQNHTTSFILYLWQHFGNKKTVSQKNATK